jgi:hypothetical protein
MQGACDSSALSFTETLSGTASIFKVVNTNFCMDISGGGLTNGIEVQLWTCIAGNTNQLFTPTNFADGSRSLASVTSGRCVDVTGASTASGALLQQWDCNGTAAQKFIKAVPSTVAPAPTPTPTPAPAPSGTFTLGMRPFTPSSSWNTTIPTTATYTNLNWPASTGFNYWVNWDQYSPSVYVGNSSDPLVQVSFPASWGWPASTIGIRIPIGVTGAAGTDGEILLLDGTTVHNCWQFVRTSNTTGTCQAYGRTDLITGSGWGSKFPNLGAGIVAAGSSQLAGLIVQAETNAGEINHALQIALNFSLQKPGFTGEAIAGDGNTASGIGIEGERYAIPRTTAMPAGLSPLGQKVFRAMQNYGVFNIDQAGATILRAQANAYDGNTIGALGTDVNKLIPLLKRVN